MSSRARALLGRVLVVVAVGSAAGGCAYQQAKLDTIDRGDRDRFIACRQQVTEGLCGSQLAIHSTEPRRRGDCSAWVGRLYLAQPPRTRRQWLLDSGCPERRVRAAEQAGAPNRGQFSGGESPPGR